MGYMTDKPRGTLPRGVSGAPVPKIGYFGWKTWKFSQQRIISDHLLGKQTA